MQLQQFEQKWSNDLDFLKYPTLYHVLHSRAMYNENIVCIKLKNKLFFGFSSLYPRWLQVDGRFITPKTSKQLFQTHILI